MIRRRYGIFRDLTVPDRSRPDRSREAFPMTAGMMRTTAMTITADREPIPIKGDGATARAAGGSRTVTEAGRPTGGSISTEDGICLTAAAT